jgi:hypothetical protein
MTITFMMETFNKGYENFLKDTEIHRSTKYITLKKFETHLGIVHVANFENRERYVQYRIENKEKFRVGKVKYNL